MAITPYKDGLIRTPDPTGAAGLAINNNFKTLFDVIDGGIKTIVLTAAGGWPSTTGGCADNVKVEYGTVDMYHLDFNKDADEYAQWTVVMPDNWNGGTLAAIFYWTCAAGGSEFVTWAIQGRAYADNDPINASWGTAQVVNDDRIANNDIHVSGATPAITLAGVPAGGQMVQIRVYRDTSAED